MKKLMVGVAVLCCVVLLCGIAVAQEKARTEKVLAGCAKEVATYCKDVTPGKGRLLSCLYAYEDKISTQCQMALCEAVPALEMALTTLSYLAGECRDDLMKYCSDVKVGEGRLIKCLDKNRVGLSDRCKAAVEEVVVK